MKKVSIIFLVALGYTILTGCKIGPEYSRPQTLADVSDGYAYADPNQQDVNDLSAIDNWWESFGDPVTSELVKEALANNYDLKAAAAGENEEWTELYPKFAEVAKAEGFSQVAAAFTMMAKVEKEHEARYLALLANVEQGRVFKKEQPVRWKCRSCGYVHEGNAPPAKCPACLVEQKEFEVKAENY